MKRTVLIVDDSGDCAETLELALDGLTGFSTSVVHSAEEALAVFKKESVAAMVTDLHLPKMEGIELVHVVRSLPGGRDMPILVVSGDSDPGTPALVLRAGANAFFAKPYSPAAVRKRIKDLLLVAENGRNEHGPSA